MTQPRRRRRGRRKGRGTPSSGAAQPQASQPTSEPKPPTPRARSRRSRSRRKGRAQEGGPAVTRPSVQSSEDLVRAGPRPRPQNLTAPPDGQRLEDIIKDLQSDFGVPQYPQEYRITLKVADDKEARIDRSTPGKREARAALKEKEDVAPRTASLQRAEGPGGIGAPKREKAPAAPRLTTEEGAGGEAAPATSRRRSRRRRRGRKKS